MIYRMLYVSEFSIWNENRKIGNKSAFAPLLEKKLTSQAAAEQICEIEGDNIVHKNTAAYWFKRFSSGDTNLEDRPRSGRPVELDGESLIEAITKEPLASTRDLSAGLGPSYSTISRHLGQLGFC